MKMPRARPGRTKRVTTREPRAEPGKAYWRDLERRLLAVLNDPVKSTELFIAMGGGRNRHE